MYLLEPRSPEADFHYFSWNIVEKNGFYMVEFIKFPNFVTLLPKNMITN